MTEWAQNTMTRAILLALQREGGFVLLETVRMLVTQDIEPIWYRRFLKQMESEGLVECRAGRLFRLRSKGQGGLH